MTKLLTPVALVQTLAATQAQAGICAVVTYPLAESAASIPPWRYLNLREGPSANARIIEKLRSGDVLWLEFYTTTNGKNVARRTRGGESGEPAHDLPKSSFWAGTFSRDVDGMGLTCSPSLLKPGSEQFRSAHKTWWPLYGRLRVR